MSTREVTGLRMRYRSSLYLRLVLTLLGPLLLAMTAAWAIGVGVITNALERRLEVQLRNAASVLSTGELPYTADLLRRLAALQQSDFVLLDGAGAVALATSSEVAAAVAESLAQERPWPSSQSRRLAKPVQSIAVFQQINEIRDSGYSALVAVAPLGDVAAAADRAARWLGFAMLAAAALLGTVLLVMVRNITRPLSQLCALADRIAAGEREERLDLARADEIGTLAESLNSMMQRLATYEARLTSRSRLSALGEMSARVAHEIRNPLTGLKLHLQLLAERLDARESTTINRLLSEVQRLELVVSSTLLLGTAQALDARPTRLTALLTEVLELMGPSLAHRGISFDIDCGDDIEAWMDRGRVRQALLNLIVNAADAMPHGGRLRVAARSDPSRGGIVISVEDTGSGVSDELRTRMRDAQVSTKPFGLGLGLTVCREVAEAHKGELRIERSAELGGARLVMALRLPAPPLPASTEH
jgi:signal transduction histidine kinase